MFTVSTVLAFVRSYWKEIKWSGGRNTPKNLMCVSSPSVYQTAAFSAEAVWVERVILLEGYHWVAVLSQRSAAGQRQQQKRQQGLQPSAP